MIKAIVFDYTGVITVTGPVGDWLKKNLDKKDEKHLLYKEHAHKWDTGEYSLDQLYDTLSDLTGVSSNKIWDTFFKTQTLNKELISLIVKLKKLYKIILFSNHEATLLKKLLTHHKINHLFDEVIISSEHKMKKPDPNFFKLLVKKSGVNKNEMVFIDDHIYNVDASNKLGIKSLHFQNFQKLRDDLKKIGVNYQ